MCALTMAVSMEFLAPTIESFAMGKPYVFLDQAKLLMLLVITGW
jgi:hypothetical protein